MIGAIPNPKKAFEVDFSAEQIISTILYIPLKDPNYSFTSKNDIFKTFRFEATEFLSVGVFIDVSISSLSDSKCKIEIEISRKVGAFDKSYEVSQANEHLNKIANLISECIYIKPEDVALLEEKNIEDSKKKSWEKPFKIITLALILTALILWIFF
jgi:hypothetical protein